ncbi:MAG: signal peptidase II [Defluviitaleaceae bacterium]|nr:signal peptidase II [Defluviitaleaceae bacterium]
MKKFIIYYLAPSLLCFALIALDQAVKRWAVASLKPVFEKPIVNGFVRFAYVENSGAAFGMLQGGRWFFVPLTVVMFAFFAVYYARLPKTRINWFVRVPMVLIAAGAAGNFVDRLRNGFVVDMFEFEFISFPVFNVADMCLVAGTFSVAAAFLFIVKERKK